MLLQFNPFMSTFPTFAVRETDVSPQNGGTSGAPLKPLGDDSALRTRVSFRKIFASLFEQLESLEEVFFTIF